MPTTRSVFRYGHERGRDQGCHDGVLIIFITITITITNIIIIFLIIIIIGMKGVQRVVERRARAPAPRRTNTNTRPSQLNTSAYARDNIIDGRRQRHDDLAHRHRWPLVGAHVSVDAVAGGADSNARQVCPTRGRVQDTVSSTPEVLSFQPVPSRRGSSQAHCACHTTADDDANDTRTPPLGRRPRRWREGATSVRCGERREPTRKSKTNVQGPHDPLPLGSRCTTVARHAALAAATTTNDVDRRT